MNQPLWESLWTVRRTTRFVVGSQVSVAIPAVVYSLKMNGRRGGCFSKADSDKGMARLDLAQRSDDRAGSPVAGRNRTVPPLPLLPARALAG